MLQNFLVSPSTSRTAYLLTISVEPGGHIQWLDLDPQSAKVISISPNTQSLETQKVAQLMQQNGADIASEYALHLNNPNLPFD